MQARIDLDGWIEVYADRGETTAVLKVWKSQIPREILRFEDEGFKVTHLCPAKAANQEYYKFSWAEPTVKGGLAEKMLEISKKSSMDKQ